MTNLNQMTVTLYGLWEQRVHITTSFRKKRGEGGRPLTAKRLALEMVVLREKLKASKIE